MTNMIDYVKNVAKSVAYSVSDELSETAETSKSFVTTNKEVLSEIYSSMRDLRKLSRRATSYVKKSKIYEAADEGIKATLEDIKTGKFYNKERIAKFEERALGSMMDFSDDDSGLDFDFDNADTGVDTDNDDMMRGFDDVEEAVVMSSRDNAAAVSTTIGKVGAASIAAGKANTMLLYDQQIKTNSIMEKGFSSIFDRLGQMNKVNTDLVSTHADNSARFYESTTKLLQEQNALLHQIVENQKMASGMTEKKKSTNNVITFNDVIGANGELNIKNYAKNIKQNLMNEMPPELKMIFGDSIGGEGSNLLLTFAASPLQFITKFVAKSLIPSVTKQAVKEFDNTLSGAFSGILARFNKMANDQDNDSEISRILGRVFGVKTNRVQSVNPKDYNKGQMPWNGIAQKSLTEVIPGYLRRIEALLSGEGERVYKWSEGKWETGREFRRNFERLKDSDISSAYGDIKYQMSDLLKRTTYFSEEEWKTINKNMDAFLKTIVSQDYGNPRFRKGDENKFYRYGVENDDIMRLLINTFQATSRSNRAQLSRKSYQARNNMANRLNNILETNMELIEMFNGSDIDKGFTWEKDGGRRTKAPGFLYNNAINKILDDHGHNVFWYLQRMYSEMVMFREAEYGGSGGGRRRSRNSHTPAPMPSNNTSTSGSASSNGRKIRTSRAIAEARTIENRSPLYESDEWMYNYLPDESLETQRIQRREQNRRAEYERGLKEARNKGLILYNSYDEGIISLINQRVNELSRESYGRRNYDEYTNSKDYKRNGSDSDTWINTAQSNARKRRERINRIDQRIRESGNDAEKYGFFDRLLAAEDTSEKLAVFTNSIDNVLQAPQKFLTNIMLKADERLYNLVFGDGEVHMLNGKPVNSIMEEITFQIKDTFGKLNKWIDEKILTPFKDKGIHTIGDIFQKIGGMFGVDLKESFAKLKEGIKKKAKSVADSTREAAGAARDFVNGSNNKKSNTRTNATNRIDINNGSIIDLFNAVGESFEDTDLDDILTDIELIAKNAHADNSIDSFDATYERSGKTNFYIDDEFIKNFTKSLGDQRFNKVKTRKDLDKLSVKNRRELMQLLIDSKNKDIKENQDKRFKMDEEITGKIFKKYGIDIKNSTIMKKIASGDLDRSTLLRAKKLQEIANNDKLDINRNAVKRLEELNNIKNRVAPGLNSRSISKDSIMKYVSENNASLDDVTKYIQESYLDNLSYNLYTKLIGDYKKETGKDFDFATLMTADENGEFDLDNNADFSKFIELLSYVTERQNVIDKNNAKKDLGEYLKTIGNKSLYNIDDLRKLGLDIRSNNNGQLNINSNLEDIIKAINSEESAIATMTSNARGTRYVTKTGITTIHEGEMIVPSELNPYNPNRGKVPKSTEIANENRVKNKFLRTLGKRIHSHSTGTYSFGTGSEMSGTIADIIPDDAEHYQKFTDENGNTIYRLKIKGNEFWHEYKLSKQQMAENGLSLDPNVHDYPPKGMSSRKIDINVNNGQTRDIELVQDKVVRGLNNALESAGMKEDYDKAMGAINKYGSAAAGGGLLGGGVGLGLSLLTGVAGGPIVGALVGAVGNIARKSDKVSNFLFGNIVDEETGERAGGLIDSEIQETFKKYAPSMSKMGIGGAIAGLVTPLGPLGGALIGSTLGFMKKNEDFQGLLFGEEGIFSEEDKTKFKKALPSIGLGAGVGALTGLLGGPFGLIGGALVGSAGGFLTTTNKFKDLVLGKEYDTGKRDEHGNPIMKRTGGVLGAVKTITIEPLKNGATYLKDHLKEFIDKDIVGPLKDGIKPVINMFKNGFETLKDTISNAINSVFEEKLGVPIGQFLKDKILNPLGKGAKTLLKLPFKMAGMAVSAPFKLLGFVGNNIRANQIKKGKDLGSTAAERLAWREKHKIRSKKIFGSSEITTDGFIGNDGYKTVDENLLNLGDQDLSQLIDNIIAIQASDSTINGQKQDAIHSIRDLITPRFDTSEQIKIFSAVKSAANSGKGNYRKAFKTIVNIATSKGLPKEEIDALINTLEERLHEFDIINYTDKKLTQNDRDELESQLRNLGFIKDKKVGLRGRQFDLKKIATMLKSEKQGRIKDNTWSLSENGESTQNSTTDAIRDQTNIQENISGNVKDIASNVNTIAEFLRKHNFAGIVNGDYAENEDEKKKSEKSRKKLARNLLNITGSAAEAHNRNKKKNKNKSSNNEENNENTSESIVNRAYGRFGGGSENAVVSQDELIVDPYSILRSNQLTDEQKELFGDKGFDILYNPLDDDETRDKKARLRAQVTDVHNAFLSGRTMDGKKLGRRDLKNLTYAISEYQRFDKMIKNSNITDQSTEEEKENFKKLTERQNSILSDIRTFMSVNTTDDGDVVKKLIDSKGNVYINKHDPKNKLGLQEGRVNNENNALLGKINEGIGKIKFGLFEKPINEKGDSIMDVAGGILKKVLKFAGGGLLISGALSTILKKFFGAKGDNLLEDVKYVATEKIAPWAKDIYNEKISPFVNGTILPFFTNTIPNFFTNTVPNAAKSAVGAIGDFAGDVWNYALNNIPKIGDMLGKGVVNTASLIGQVLPYALGGAWDATSALFGLDGKQHQYTMGEWLGTRFARSVARGNNGALLKAFKLPLPGPVGKILGLPVNAATTVAGHAEDALTTILHTSPAKGFSRNVSNLRATATGLTDDASKALTRNLSKTLGKEVAEDNIENTIKSLTVSQVRKVASNLAIETNEKLFQKLSQEATKDLLKNSTGEISKNTIKEAIKNAGESAAVKGVKTTSETLTKSISKSSLISSLGEGFAKLFDKLALTLTENRAYLKTAANLTEETSVSLEQGLRKSSKSMGANLAESLSKHGANAASKISSFFRSGGLVTIVFSVADLLLCLFSDADTMDVLSISTPPTFGQKLIAGLILMILDVLAGALGLIPGIGGVIASGIASVIPPYLIAEVFFNDEWGLLRYVNLAGITDSKKATKLVLEEFKNEFGVELSSYQLNRINGHATLFDNTIGALTNNLNHADDEITQLMVGLKNEFEVNGKEWDPEKLKKYTNFTMNSDGTVNLGGKILGGSSDAATVGVAVATSSAAQTDAIIETSTQQSTETNGILTQIRDLLSGIFGYTTGEDPSTITKDYTQYVSSNVSSTLSDDLASAIQIEYQNLLASGYTEEQASNYLSARYGSGTGRYSQKDKSINVRYNKPGDSVYQDINSSGCGPIAATNLINRHVRSGMGMVDPIDSAHYALSHGYKETNGGTDPRYFKDYFAKNGINSSITSNKQLMRKAIENGNQVVLMGKNSKYGSGISPYGPNPHYVVATGIKGSKIIVDNPEELNEFTAYDTRDTINQSSKAIITNSKYGMGTASRYYMLTQDKSINDIEKDYFKDYESNRYKEVDPKDFLHFDIDSTDNIIDDNDYKADWFEAYKNNAVTSEYAVTADEATINKMKTFYTALNKINPTSSLEYAKNYYLDLTNENLLNNLVFRNLISEFYDNNVDYSTIVARYSLPHDIYPFFFRNMPLAHINWSNWFGGTVYDPIDPSTLSEDIRSETWPYFIDYVNKFSSQLINDKSEISHSSMKTDLEIYLANLMLAVERAKTTNPDLLTPTYSVTDAYKTLLNSKTTLNSIKNNISSYINSEGVLSNSDDYASSLLGFIRSPKVYGKDSKATQEEGNASYTSHGDEYIDDVVEKINLDDYNRKIIPESQGLNSLLPFFKQVIYAITNMARVNTYIKTYDEIFKEMKKAKLISEDQFNIENSFVTPSNFKEYLKTAGEQSILLTLTKYSSLVGDPTKSDIPDTFKDTTVDKYFSDLAPRKYLNDVLNSGSIIGQELFYNKSIPEYFMNMDLMLNNGFDINAVPTSDINSNKIRTPFVLENKLFNHSSQLDEDLEIKNDSDADDQAFNLYRAVLNYATTDSENNRAHMLIHPDTIVKFYKKIIELKYPSIYDATYDNFNADAFANENKNNVIQSRIIDDLVNNGVKVSPFFGNYYLYELMKNNYPKIEFASGLYDLVKMYYKEKGFANNLLYRLLKINKGIDIKDYDILTSGDNQRINDFYKQYIYDKDTPKSREYLEDYENNGTVKGSPLRGALSYWSKDIANIEDFIDNTLGDPFSFMKDQPGKFLSSYIYSYNSYIKGSNVKGRNIDTITDMYKRAIYRYGSKTSDSIAQELSDVSPYSPVLISHLFTDSDVNYLEYILNKTLESKIQDIVIKDDDENIIETIKDKYSGYTLKDAMNKDESEMRFLDIRRYQKLLNILKTYIKDKSINSIKSYLNTDNYYKADQIIPGLELQSWLKLDGESEYTTPEMILNSFLGLVDADDIKSGIALDSVVKAREENATKLKAREILYSSDNILEKAAAFGYVADDAKEKLLQLQVLFNRSNPLGLKSEYKKLKFDINASAYEYLREAFSNAALMPKLMFENLYLTPIQADTSDGNTITENTTPDMLNRFNTYLTDDYLNSLNYSLRVTSSPTIPTKIHQNIFKAGSGGGIDMINYLNNPKEDWHPEYLFGVPSTEPDKALHMTFNKFDYNADEDSDIMQAFDNMIKFVVDGTTGSTENLGSENVFKPIVEYMREDFTASNKYLTPLLEWSNEDIIKLLSSADKESVISNHKSSSSSPDYLDEQGNVVSATGLTKFPDVAFENLTKFSKLTGAQLTEAIAKLYNDNGAQYRPLKDYGPQIATLADKYNVNPRFVIAVMWTECNMGAGSDNTSRANHTHEAKYNYISLMDAGKTGNSGMHDFKQSGCTINGVSFKQCSNHSDMLDNIFKFFSKISFEAPRMQRSIFALNYTKGYSYRGGKPSWVSTVCNIINKYFSGDLANTEIEYLHPTDAQMAFYKEIEGTSFDKDSVPEDPKNSGNKLTEALFKIAEGVWGSDLITWIRNKFSGEDSDSSSERDTLYQLAGSTTRNVADTFKLALTDEDKNSIYSGITSNFGPRSLGQHWGVDITAKNLANARIYSPISGKILMTKDRGKNGVEYVKEYTNNFELIPKSQLPSGYEYSNGYGKQVLIMDDNNNVHLFAHLKDYNKSLKEGESISAGQYIGHIGTTGKSSGNHLHYGVMHPDPSNYKSLLGVYYKGHVPTSGTANPGYDWKNVPSKWFSDSYGWMNPDEYLDEYLGGQADELAKEAEERAAEAEAAAAAAAEESSETSESTTGQGSGKMSPSELLITQGLKKSSSSSYNNYGIGGQNGPVELDSKAQSILKQGIKNANAKYGRGTAIGGAGGENTAELQTLKEITGILTSINNNTAKSNMFLAAFLKAVQNGEISTDSSMFSNMIKALSANSGLQTLASVGSTGNINKDLDDSTNTLINTMNTIARQ